MNNAAYYQRNREIILNRAKDYYEDDKERLREQARNKYRKLSEEDKKKKREYRKNRYHNVPEEKKNTKKRIPRKIFKKISRSKNVSSMIINNDLIVYPLFLVNYSSLSVSDSVSSSLKLLSDLLFCKCSSI